MYFIEIFILVAVGLILMFQLLLWGLNAIVRHGLKPRDVVIARDIHVSQKWAEFSTVKPSHPSGSMQYIFLRIPGYKFDAFGEKFNLTLPDGTIVDPDIQVIDETSAIYDTEDGHRAGNLIGFSIKRGINGKPVPRDPRRVKVQIRSEKPFECSAIGWRT